MKTKLFNLLAATAWLGCSLVAVAQGTTTISYQGRLNDNGSPGNKNYDFQFALFDAAAGGNQIGQTLTVSDQAVVNGLFTSTLDFGAGAFEGSARWLEIGVRSAGGGGNFTTLTPRQQVYPIPYSIYSAKAATVDGAANLAFTGTVSFSPSSGPPFTVGSSTKVPSLNADLLDGLDSTAFVLRAGDTMSGSLAIANPATLNFGNNVRQMLNLWDVQYGIGVQANTLYYRSHNNFAWFKDGVHSDTAYDPGTGGTVLMTLGGGGNLAVTSSTGTAIQGDGGQFAGAVGVRGLTGGGLTVGVFGWATNGALAAGVYGRADGTNSIGVSGLANFATGFNYGVNGQSTSPTGVGVYGLTGGGTGSYDPAGVRGEATAFDGNGVVGVANNGPSAYALWGKSSSGYAGKFDGAVKMFFSSPFSKPQLEIDDPSDNGFVRLRLQTGSRPAWDIAVGTGASPDQTNSLRFFNSGSGGGDVMTISPQGHVHLRVLTIDGGADVAEPFEMSESNLSKGAVVVIDAEHPGRLKLSTQAYDTRVAGVISGAGGVNPGLSLNQRGVMEGDQPVALSGRVYVQADASFGSILPGDLLTTSDTPGRAMKVKDHGRAQGAILGKAMTGLDEGEGLVLVLVTLQ